MTIPLEVEYLREDRSIDDGNDSEYFTSESDIVGTDDES